MNHEQKKSAIRNHKQLLYDFVQYINEQNSEKLAEMMADGFKFTDIAGDVFIVYNREEKKKFWTDYFSDFPAYQIHIEKILSGGFDIAFIGKTTGSHVPGCIEVNEILIWYAEIKNGQISEWRIFSTEDYAF